MQTYLPFKFATCCPERDKICKISAIVIVCSSAIFSLIALAKLFHEAQFKYRT